MGKIFRDITNSNEKNIKLVIRKSGQRKKLVEWLYEVMVDFGYSQITYARAIFIIDKYSQKNGVDFSKYQLLGITALFIGAKLEEKVLASIKEYSAVTDYSFKTNEILVMELNILKTLEFNLCFMMPHNYVTLTEVSKIIINLPIREKKELFYAAITQILESEETTGNIYNIFVKSRSIVEEMVSNKSVDNDLYSYLNRVRKLTNLSV